MSRALNTAYTQQNNSGASAPFDAGKNKILNGDFNINQRSFTSITNNGYGHDRWLQVRTNGTVTYSTETFTLGSAPVAGYESKNFARQVVSGHTGSATDYAVLVQRIESVRILANQTAVVSFWAKAASGTPKVAVTLRQSFGTGGSPSSDVDTHAGQVTLSTSWARYSVKVTIPSIAGKTLGTANDDQLALYFFTSAGSNYNSITGSLGYQNNTFDIWGVQLEAGSVATPFSTATGNPASELAACQRYYWRNTPSAGGAQYWAQGRTTSVADCLIQFPVTMRANPSAVEYGGTWSLTDPNVNSYSMSSIAFVNATTYNSLIQVTTSVNLAQGKMYSLGHGANAYLGFSAEL